MRKDSLPAAVTAMGCNPDEEKQSIGLDVILFDSYGILYTVPAKVVE
jgi:hypothetical protein